MARTTRTIEERAAEAEQAAASLRAQAERQQLDALDRYEQRLAEHDRQQLDAYDAHALEEARSSAYQNFEKAIAESDIFSSWVAFRVANGVTQQRASEAQAQATALGDDRRIHVPGFGAEDLITALRAALEKAAGDEVGRIMDERAEQRERYASGEQTT